MEVKFEEFKDLCEAKFSGVAEGDEWKEAQKKALNKLAKNVTVKGFRKGHAPIEQAARLVKTVDVLNEAADQIIDKAYRQMFDQYQVRPMVQPELKVTEFSQEKLAFEFVCVTEPTCKLGTYKGIAIERPAVKVSKAEVDAELQNRANKNAELVVAEADYEAQLGDTLNIDFKGYVDQVAFDGGDAKGYDLELGSNTFIPGFEAQLVGKKTGVDCEVKVTFPENYVANLANKDATFKVHVNSVKKKVVPELNDDFAKDLDIEGVDTLEQLTENVKEELKNKKNNQLDGEQFEKLVNQIVDGASFNVHEKMVEENANRTIKNLEEKLNNQGLKLDDYLKMTNKKHEDLVNEAKVQALNELKRAYVLEQVSKDENITITEEEVDAKLGEFAAMYKTDVATLKKQLGDNLNGYVYNLKLAKVNEWLKANNNLAAKKQTKKED